MYHILKNGPTRHQNVSMWEYNDIAKCFMTLTKYAHSRFLFFISSHENQASFGYQFD